MMFRQSSDSTTIRVLAAVIERGDTRLLCQRSDGRRHGGCWEFPGGKLEPGESHADAALRELMEELGVRAVEVGAVLHSVHDEGSPYIIDFVAVRIDGEPEPLEHAALRWTTLEEALALPLAPADRAFVISALRTR
jgi:mutator protein MutT